MVAGKVTLGRRRAIAFVPAFALAVVLALALVMPACSLFRGQEAPHISPPPLKYRFVLLAPFKQVAVAAGAELKAMGATDKEGGGEDSVSFRLTNKQREGEDTITLRQEGTSLIFEFRLHKPPEASDPGAPIHIVNPGEGLKNPGDDVAKDLVNPGEKTLDGVASGDENDPSHTTASGAEKGSLMRIVKLLVCLPGVGDLVDQDGVPKAIQPFRGDGGVTALCHVSDNAGETTTDASGGADASADASGDAAISISDGGVSDARARDARANTSH